MADEKSLPQHVIEIWPEVFCDISVNVIPLRYVYAVEITFKNQTSKVIKLNPYLKVKNHIELEEEIKDIILRYCHNMHSIDFKLDTNKMKQDIRYLTNTFLKNKRLK